MKKRELEAKIEWLAVGRRLREQEIERLRADEKATVFGYELRIESLKAELRRLRSELDDQRSIRLAAEDEVEALTRDLGEAHAQRMRAIKKNDEAWAEVDRLDEALETRTVVTLLNEPIGTAVDPDIDTDAVLDILEKFRQEATQRLIEDTKECLAYRRKWDEEKARLQAERDAAVDALAAKVVEENSEALDRLAAIDEGRTGEGGMEWTLGDYFGLGD